MFVLYLVKTSDVSESTQRRWPLLFCLLIEPECRTFFKSLFKLWHYNLYQNIHELTYYPPNIKFVQLFCQNANFSGAWLLHDLFWSASACHRRGNRPCGVDGWAPVWEL